MLWDAGTIRPMRLKRLRSKNKKPKKDTSRKTQKRHIRKSPKKTHQEKPKKDTSRKNPKKTHQEKPKKMRGREEGDGLFYLVHGFTMKECKIEMNFSKKRHNNCKSKRLVIVTE